MKGPIRGATGQTQRPAASVTDNWQLLPPIVTGRLPALKASNAAPVKGIKPVASVSAPPTLPPLPPQEIVTLVQTPPAKPAAPQSTAPQPKAKPEKSKANTGNSMPGTNADTSELVKAYEWWSLSDQVQTSAEPAARSAPAPSNERAQPLPLTNEVDWTAEPLSSEFTTRGRNQKSAQRSKKMPRRKVFAFIAAGGVAVAGTALFLNLGHLGGKATTQTAAQPMNMNNKPAPQQQANNNPAPQQQANNKPAANQGQMAMQDVPAAKTGTVVGSTQLGSNTSVDFTNPADKKPSVLINLPGNNFVAYEKACTHEGVIVNYDPATKMLVCPAHGAIFDPAKGASVVQGPAEQPLPQVHVKVNGDGTITAV